MDGWPRSPEPYRRKREAVQAVRPATGCVFERPGDGRRLIGNSRELDPLTQESRARRK